MFSNDLPNSVPSNVHWHRHCQISGEA
uniref:Uncharacterized protein n=1 Tax=Arundo donax TaxID=35708 RepID=A0A0A9EGT9_ARUDO